MIQNATYFVAKHIPELMRFEPRNVGVIVWSSVGIEARFAAESRNSRSSIDGRKIPNFVTDDNAYRQWISYWREQIQTANSLESVEGISEASRGNYVLTKAGEILEPIDQNNLADVVDNLFETLVAEPSARSDVDHSREGWKQLFDLVHLREHRYFRNDYAVSCKVRRIEEEFTFDHALVNGEIKCLMKYVPLPSSGRARIQQLRDSVAWQLDNVLSVKRLSKEQVVLMLNVDVEHASEDVKKTMELFSDLSVPLNLRRPAEAEAKLGDLARL